MLEPGNQQQNLMTEATAKFIGIHHNAILKTEHSQPFSIHKQSSGKMA
jgi:hypothetical protein